MRNFASSLANWFCCNCMALKVRYLFFFVSSSLCIASIVENQFAPKTWKHRSAVWSVCSHQAPKYCAKRTCSLWSKLLRIEIEVPRFMQAMDQSLEECKVLNVKKVVLTQSPCKKTKKLLYVKWNQKTLLSSSHLGKPGTACAEAKLQLVQSTACQHSSLQSPIPATFHGGQWEHTSQAMRKQLSKGRNKKSAGAPM